MLAGVVTELLLPVSDERGFELAFPRLGVCWWRALGESGRGLPRDSVSTKARAVPPGLHRLHSSAHRPPFLPGEPTPDAIKTGRLGERPRRALPGDGQIAQIFLAVCTLSSFPAWSGNHVARRGRPGRPPDPTTAGASRPASSSRSPVSLHPSPCQESAGEGGHRVRPFTHGGGRVCPGRLRGRTV